MNPFSRGVASAYFVATDFNPLDIKKQIGKRTIGSANIDMDRADGTFY